MLLFSARCSQEAEIIPSKKNDPLLLAHERGNKGFQSAQ